MPKLKKPLKTFVPINKLRILSDDELKSFDYLVREKFFVKRRFTQTGGDTKEVFDTEAYLKSVGAYNPYSYEIEMDRIEQWIRWCGKKQFAIKKQLSGYDDSYQKSRASINKMPHGERSAE